jgi:HAD superfamily hydrolase (TIGR01509 family)
MDAVRAGEGMIRAFIFDLDGTLVETEQLKAKAYALVSQQLLGLPGPDERAISLYRGLVGGTDETVSKAMIAGLGLEAALQKVCGALSGETGLWRVLHTLRMDTYRSTVGTQEAIRAAAYGHTLAVVREQKAAGRKAAVATSSYTDEARRVLHSLGVLGLLDAVIGREQVTRAKPDPEIYLFTMKMLGVQPGHTLIVEDSPAGLQAAAASGAHWVCVANEFSKDSLRMQSDLDQRWIVYEPNRVREVVLRRIAASETV